MDSSSRSDIFAIDTKGYNPANVGMAFSPKRQELIILPTEKCNLRCTYCYEDFAIGRMKPPVVAALKKFIARRIKNVGVLQLSWFGGEPLLAKDICLDVMKFAKQQCDEDGVLLMGGMTTNGVFLTLDLASELAKYNHRQYQITLDGDEQFHNAVRVSKSKKGSFSTIWGNLETLASSSLDLDVMLRIHIHPENYDSVRGLIGRINRLTEGDRRFRVHFHRISNLGGPNGSNVSVLPVDVYNNIVTDLGRQLSVKYESEMIRVENYSICYAAQANSLLVRADGRLGKCTVALDDPRNHIGNLRDDGTLEVFNERFQLWLEGFETFNKDTLSCPLSTLRNLPNIKDHGLSATLVG